LEKLAGLAMNRSHCHAASFEGLLVCRLQFDQDQSLARHHGFS
jgi:hypothetical protein